MFSLRVPQRKFCSRLSAGSPFICRHSYPSGAGPTKAFSTNLCTHWLFLLPSETDKCPFGIRPGLSNLPCRTDVYRPFTGPSQIITWGSDLTRPLLLTSYRPLKPLTGTHISPMFNPIKKPCTAFSSCDVGGLGRHRAECRTGLVCKRAAKHS